MKNIAIVLAGGSGNRFGDSTPKQFAKIAGKKIIEHTLDIFQNHDLIDEIAIVIHSSYIESIKDIVLQGKYTKVKKVLNGGSTRNESSLSGINAYKQETNSANYNLIFHDAVRPFLSNQIIDHLIDALTKYNAIDVAVPSTDTIIEVGKDQFIRNIPNRDHLYNGQTPQAFKLNTIAKAYDIASTDSDFRATDDCGVILKYLPDEKIYVVKGEQSNIKITYGIDLFISDKLFQLKNESIYKSIDYRELNEKVLIVFGGNSGIGKDMADIAKTHGAHVYTYSRSLNGVDISDKLHVRNVYKEVYEKHKRIDFIVNTAAILKKEPLDHMSDDTVLSSVNTNFLGMIHVAKESIPYLEESKGSLLLFTSSSYTRGRAYYSIYSSSKAAVVNFTQALAEEWNCKGIRINCINPERTKTPMRVENFGNEPDNTLLMSEQVAQKSMETLLSDITGQIVYVKL